MNKVLVTGAGGHIGNVLVRELLAQEQEVRALLLPAEDRSSLNGLDVEILEGDVLDIGCLRRALQGVRVVYHLAGVVTILPGQWDLLERVNIEGTRNVLRACEEAGVGRLVYTSSIHAIAPPPMGQTIDERLPFDPARTWGEYDRSKATASLEVKRAAAQGLDAVLVCPTGVIGPYDFRRSEMGQFLLDCASRGPKMYIDGAYDFVDVRDVARGHILACQRGTRGEHYILSGARITVQEIMETVEAILQIPGPNVFVPVWLARWASVFTPLYYRITGAKPKLTPYSVHTVTSNCQISSEKAQRELGYRPRALPQSIADTLKWFLDRGDLRRAATRHQA
ncbi:MAG: SDR family oxidoreductase [Anaerolineales bacterium]|jgi:dihydroflavonol-4-reductase